MSERVLIQIQIGFISLKLVRLGRMISEETIVIQPGTRKKWLLPLAGATLALLLSLSAYPFLNPGHQAVASLPVTAVPKRPPIADLRGMALKRGEAKPGGRKLASRPADPPQNRGNLIRVVQLGEQAEAAFDGGSFIEAASLWRQVLAISPLDQPAQDGLQRLEKVAGKLYEEAMMLKTSAPAQFKEKIQITLAISDPGSDVHAKARRLMGRPDQAGGLS